MTENKDDQSSQQISNDFIQQSIQQTSDSDPDKLKIEEEDN